jgi:hypothetical protein
MNSSISNTCVRQSAPRRPIIALAALLVIEACLSPVCPANDPKCSPAGGGGGGGGGGSGQQRCEMIVGAFQGQVCVTLQPVMCAGVQCDAGSDCCFTSGKCFDPATDSAACPTPTGDGACASNRDCGTTQACITQFTGGTNLCGGYGKCQPIDNCPSCEPVGTPQCEQCGCDGHTYESIQAACVAGIRVAVEGPCGMPVQSGGQTIVGCGDSTQCTMGQQCCFLTGHCYDPTQPWRCEQQPDGTVLDCASNAECAGGTGGNGGADHFCAASGCDTPGRCTPIASPSSCGGQLQPVCGCDGTTYTNECWARSAGTSVAASGACDGGP